MLRSDLFIFYFSILSNQNQSNKTLGVRDCKLVSTIRSYLLFI